MTHVTMTTSAKMMDASTTAATAPTTIPIMAPVEIPAGGRVAIINGNVITISQSHLVKNLLWNLLMLW